MSARNDLLLAALKRAGKPLDSGDVLDAAVGLAMADGWEPEQVASLNRRSIATRLQNMVDEGLLTRAGMGMDNVSRRTTPLYAPAAGYDAHAAVPKPPTPARAPAARASVFDGLSTTQTCTLLDVQDELLALFARQQQAQQQVQQQFMQELAVAREKARNRLLAAGLGRD